MDLGGPRGVDSASMATARMQPPDDAPVRYMTAFPVSWLRYPLCAAKRALEGFIPQGLQQRLHRSRFQDAAEESPNRIVPKSTL